MKKMPLGMQTFRKIVEGNYVYVDKTQHIYNLLNDASCYFLSRPRRFGKSLLLDTIAEVFSGDKELFKGLFIYDSDYSFEKHPVLRFDMSNIAGGTPERLEAELLFELSVCAEAEGFTINQGSPSAAFKTLIRKLSDKYSQRVVVLIDEYDKPILDQINNPKVAELSRAVLRGFYGVLKSMDPHLSFTFITGVTKFTKTSVFSGLNNLSDITLSQKYANICGIEVNNLGKHFSEHIDALNSLSEFDDVTNLHDEILSWYDGYSWDGQTRVINPFSLLSFFSAERFSSFWYASGTPKFLLDLIKKRPRGYTDLMNLEIGEWSLDTFDIHAIEVEPLLFQTGYLTIKEIPPKQRPPSYLLKIPNNEVRIAFNLHILAEFTESGATFAETSHRKISKALKEGNLQAFLEILRALFASIPYEIHIGKEAYYRSIFYAIMNLLGFDVDAEVSVSRGRIDATLELEDKVYVFEFKYEHCPPDASSDEKRELFDKTLNNGMKQLIDRGYAKKFESSGKQIYQAAFAFLGRDDIEMIDRLLS